jgi:hypothetical protein
MGRILTEMSSLFHFTGRQAGRKLQIVYGNVTGGHQSRADYRSPPGNVVPKQIWVGSSVLARLHDGREVQTTATKIVDSLVF